MTRDDGVSGAFHRRQWPRRLVDILVVFLFFLLIALIHASVSGLQLLRFVDYFSVLGVTG